MQHPKFTSSLMWESSQLVEKTPGIGLFFFAPSRPYPTRLVGKGNARLLFALLLWCFLALALLLGGELEFFLHYKIVRSIDHLDIIKTYRLCMFFYLVSTLCVLQTCYV